MHQSKTRNWTVTINMINCANCKREPTWYSSCILSPCQGSVTKPWEKLYNKPHSPHYRYFWAPNAVRLFYTYVDSPDPTAHLHTCPADEHS